ncbi:MAG TPA: spirocyclase AveC family protein [Acidimicrobiia bacterium]
MSTLTREARRPVIDPAPGRAPGSARPVHIWAGVGGVLLAVTLGYTLKWVAGPDFVPVPTGPDRAPGWMRAALLTGQIAFPLLALLLGWFLVVRPWRRHRTVGIDGLLWIAAVLVSVWDPLSNAFHSWFLYNANLANRGSILSALPGPLSRHAQGPGSAWPFFMPSAYVLLLVVVPMIGGAVLRAAERAFPRLTTAGLVAVCIVFLMFVDVVVEGLFFLPLGFCSYAGGWWPVTFGGHYFQLPFNEMFHVSLFMATPTLLRYFTDDKAHTLVERGIDAVSGSVKRVTLRALAVFAWVFLGLLVAYHIPEMIWASHAHDYPRDVQTRSYFVEGTR